MTTLQSARARRPLRILLVEDSPLLRNRLVRMLSEHEVMEVAGCAAAEAEAIAKLGVENQTMLGAQRRHLERQ